MFFKTEVWIGDGIEFDCHSITEGASRNIFVKVTETIGRKAVLNIVADRSILIRHVKKNQVGKGIERDPSQ